MRSQKHHRLPGPPGPPAPCRRTRRARRGPVSPPGASERRPSPQTTGATTRIQPERILSAAMSVKVEVATTVNAELVEAFDRLLPQLSRNAAPLDADALTRLVEWPGNQLLVARVDDRILGVLTLVMFPIPTGLRAWIEDVVVDEAGRGQGIGADLTTEAIRLAHLAGARTVDLTSRPSRQSANRLYERLGFQLRDSQVYRHVP
nr:GNAT family N-acetyltransferase [Frankia sp. AgW1.1]